MVNYDTCCPYCGHKFTIKTAKTRYSEHMTCHECNKKSIYYITPKNLRLVMVGQKIQC